MCYRYKSLLTVGGLVLVGIAIVASRVFLSKPPPNPFIRCAKLLDEIRLQSQMKRRPHEWWLEPNIVDSFDEDISLLKDQPYSQYGVYVFESTQLEQALLYAPEIPLELPEAQRIRACISDNMDARGAVVIACFMAAGRTTNGRYYPYDNKYFRTNSRLRSAPLNTRGLWLFLDGFDAMVDWIPSGVPPVPGSIAIVRYYGSQAKSDSFYYPEEILPLVRAIYPDIVIREDLIIHKGRDIGILPLRGLSSGNRH